MELFVGVKLESGFAGEFSKNVIKEMAKKIKQKADVIRTTITNDLRKSVRESLISTPEYRSILQGKLRGELGIPNSDVRIITIIDTWVNNISVKVKAGKNPFLLIDIGIIKDDYLDVLSLPQSSYTYEGRRGQAIIPWLKWLLLEGDKRIITKYEFTSAITRNSRTGMGIMISKQKGTWQVPPEYSGTSVDNFATRALGNIESVIDDIVERAVKGSLQ
tara:strand:+ start:1816 stop:2469 length:654 start_codon:yes stop_codon:yes gene_type:complete